MGQKISNILLAFKFAMLDCGYAKGDIMEIINRHPILHEGESFTSKDIDIDCLINFNAHKGELLIANKIVLELLRKKKQLELMQPMSGYLKLSTQCFGLED